MGGDLIAFLVGLTALGALAAWVFRPHRSSRRPRQAPSASSGAVPQGPADRGPPAAASEAFVSAPSEPWPNIILEGRVGLERCIARGDWATARTALQKVAYTLVDAPQAQKDAFTRLCLEFVPRDPLYQRVVSTAVAHIQANPGCRQTQLYPLLPDLDPEWVRYAIYYAAELGVLRRTKKGNSYALWIEPEPAPVAGTERSLSVATDDGVVEVRTRMEVVSSDVDPIAVLHKEATRLSAEGRLDDACEALRKAKPLMYASPVCYPAESWCRLPLYLQKAGRFDESMQEFDELSARLEQRARRDSRIDDPNVGPYKSKLSTYTLIIERHGEVIANKRALAQRREAKKGQVGAIKKGSSTPSSDRERIEQLAPPTGRP